MASALQHRAATDPVSDEEMLEAKNEFVERYAAELLAKNLFDLFCELNGDEAEMLHKLMTGSHLDLIELQQRFRDRMEHEARVMASRDWTATAAASAAMRIQDGRIGQ